MTEETKETTDPTDLQRSTSEHCQEDKPKKESKEEKPWWQNPTTVTLLVAIIAAAAPLSTGVQGWIQASNELALDRAKHESQLELERAKQLHEMRQKYLDRVLSNQNIKVLEFLVAVEEDVQLKSWAEDELAKARGDFDTKQELYTETIRVVANLANSQESISADLPEWEKFWSLYDEKLLLVESAEVEALMVTIGSELKRLSAEGAKPSIELKNLSFKLARTMKEELL